MIRKVLFLLVLLACPWVYSYGQLHFATVNGERGYAAMRGNFVWNLDNGFILIPSGGYYRISDKEEETGATGKIALDVLYEVDDQTTVFAGGSYIPRRMGFQNAGYHMGTKYNLCYHCGPFKNVYSQALFGQTFYDLTAYANGMAYPGHFKSTATLASAEVGSEVGKFFIQAIYHKVIKYNHRPPNELVSNWTEIPFMTAIVQGYVRDIAAAKLSYRTWWITPYAVYSRYQYLAYSNYTVSIAGGISLHWGKSTFSGGVEIFEQNQQENRKTYFSLSASTEF